MKKSLILALAASLLLSSCSILDDPFEIQSTCMTREQVGGKTSYASFTELNKPIIYTVTVTDEYFVNSDGEIAVIYDWENDKVFDWVYLDCGTVSSNGIANELQETAASPLTYILPANYYNKMYFMNPAETTPTVFEKTTGGNPADVLSPYDTKPRYALLKDYTYASGKEGDTTTRNGIILNTIDCADGKISETTGIEALDNWPEVVVDADGLYWFVINVPYMSKLVCFDPVANTITETNYTHSMYPDDVLQALLEAAANAAEDDGEDGDDDGSEPDPVPDYGYESMRIKYVSSSKIYIHDYRNFPRPAEEQNYDNGYYDSKEYLIAVDRTTFTAQEYCLSDSPILDSYSFSRMFEANGKLWVTATGYYATDTAGTHFFIFDESADIKNCFIDENKFLYDVEVENQFYIRGTRYYGVDITEDDGGTISWIDLESGEKMEKKNIANSQFNCSPK